MHEGLVVKSLSLVIVGVQQFVGLVGIGLAQIFVIQLLDLGIVVGLAQMPALVLGVRAAARFARKVS